jgi:hypothetical protein
MKKVGMAEIVVAMDAKKEHVEYVLESISELVDDAYRLREDGMELCDEHNHLIMCGGDLDKHRFLKERGLSFRMIDLENVFDKLKDIQNDLWKFEKDARDNKEVNGSLLWACDSVAKLMASTWTALLEEEKFRYNWAEAESGEEAHTDNGMHVDSDEWAKRNSDRRMELTPWETSQMLLEYVQEKYKIWSWKELISVSRLVNKKHAANEIRFPHWVCCKMMLEHSIWTTATSKRARGRAKAAFEKFRDMYEQHGVDVQLEHTGIDNFAGAYVEKAMGNYGIHWTRHEEFCDVMRRARNMAENDNNCLGDIRLAIFKIAILAEAKRLLGVKRPAKEVTVFSTVLAYDYCEGDKTETCDYLGISRRTLERRLLKAKELFAKCDITEVAKTMGSVA